MKTTYLIYKQIDGDRKLVKATQEEWDAILKANRGLPMENRRLFIKDCFDDGLELDCMYIEVPYEKYKEWHSRDEITGRKRRSNCVYPVISMDAPVQDTEVNSLHEAVPAEFDLEKIAMDKVLLDELRTALTAWKPWAPEFLSIYLDGKRRYCTPILCEKYGLKERAVRYRKEQFEAFVKNFLK